MKIECQYRIVQSVYSLGAFCLVTRLFVLHKELRARESAMGF